MKKVVSKLGLIAVSIAVIGLLSLPSRAQINNYVKINIRPGTYVNVNGNLTNTSSGIISNNGNIILTGDFQNDGAFNSGMGSDVKFNGITEQQIKGSVVTTFQNLTVAGTSNKRLVNAAKVADSLQFLANRLIIGNNNLTLLPGANISGAGRTKFVVTNGTGSLIKKIVPTNTNVLFPVGDSIKYKPVVLSYQGTLDTFSVRVIPGLNPSLGSFFDSYYVQATYIVQESVAGGTTQGNLSLGWDTTSEGVNFVRTNAKMVNNVGGNWQPPFAGNPGAIHNPIDSDYYYPYQLGGITDFSANASKFAIQGNLPACSDPTSISASVLPVCRGSSTTLTVVGGSAACGHWVWYSGGCAQDSVGIGPSVSVSPTSTTMYYVRAEGYQPGDTTNCAFLMVVVYPTSLATPGTINGPTTACSGASQNYYLSFMVPGATTYTWSFPSGWTINSGQGTINVNATPGGAGQNGNIIIVASNPCGTSSPRTLYVTALPGTPVKPWDIVGANPACLNTSQVYTTPAVPGATNYAWTFPSGWSITSGQGTNSITVYVGSAAQAGNIIVNASNSCGTSNDYSIVGDVHSCFKTLNLIAYLEGFYLGSNTMKAAIDTSGGSFITKWPGFTDTMAVVLHDTTHYSHIIYTAHNIFLQTNGKATVNIPPAYSGIYYLTVQHRNHLETTSSRPVSFSGSAVNYDFSLSPAQAYGNNMKVIGGTSVIYAGDLTRSQNPYPGTTVKDGVIDISDVYYIFDSYLNGDFGYKITDLSGDGAIDLTDVYDAFNNYLLGIYAILPTP